MRKIGLLCLVLLLVLGTLGTGYAYWTETLTIIGNVNTGELDWCYTGWIMQYEIDKDVLAEPGMNFSQLTISDYDAAYTEYDLEDTDADGDLDTLNIHMEDAYPGYYNEVDFKVINNGTLPLVIKGATLEYGGSVTDLTNGSVETTSDNAFQFRLSFNDNTYMEPASVTLTSSIEILCLQDALESHDYDFTIKMNAVQFNQP